MLRGDLRGAGFFFFSFPFSPFTVDAVVNLGFPRAGLIYCLGVSVSHVASLHDISYPCVEFLGVFICRNFSSGEMVVCLETCRVIWW